MPDYIDNVFASGGLLAQRFPGYQPRSGQIALARAVDRSIRERTHLVSEAPCGTGKGIAYIVPASYHSARSGKQIAIITSAINLQEQLVDKDLPMMQSILPWEFTFALQKGRQNYLCADSYYERQALLATLLTHDDSRSVIESKQLPIVDAWAKACIDGGTELESGDRSDLPFEPAYDVWKRFSVSGDECKKAKCRFKDECFPNAAYDRAKKANIVVTNYAMLFAHLDVYLKSGKDLILPPFEICIMDEAHQASSIARDHFGFRHTHESVRRLARKLKNTAPQMVDILDRTSRIFFNAMSGYRRDRNRYKARITNSLEDHERKAWSALKQALEQTVHTYSQQIIHGPQGMKEELEIYQERTQNTLANLTTAIEDPSGTRHVHFLEEDDVKKTLAVVSKLVHPSDALTPGLFEKWTTLPSAGVDELGLPIPGERRPVTVIATSATLATGAGDFAFAVEEMGVPRDHHELVAESPFDWPQQCLFIVPETMPDPTAGADAFRSGVVDHMKRIVAFAGGRTLGLFTSRIVMERTYDALVPTCHQLGVKLLKQGDAPRSRLIETFKSDITSVLFGTESFWAGVDVPGEALSIVVIDRLPFPQPEDPIMDVLSEQDPKAFWHYAVPSSIVKFRQGFGRLIRSMECRGVVVCLDTRIISKKYGKRFLRALPNVPKSVHIEDIPGWLSPATTLAWDEL
jgi:ATP-dependent DNA helicase DinG